jgi:hypothetical protein
MTHPQTVLTQALAAGAAMKFRPNRLTVPIVEQPMYDAYETLRALLAERYPTINVGLLDIAPASAERRAQLDEQVRQSGAMEDDDIQKQVVLLLEEIAEHAPEAVVASGPGS